MRDVLEAWLASLRGGRPAALVTVVRATGSTPRAAGARMLVREDGSTVGTVGGGAFEALATRDALDLLAAGETGPVTKRYAFTEEGEDALGMACGGNAEVWIERVGAGPRLVIYGCGHVGIALARLAGAVGFDCTLVDDREEAAGRDFPREVVGAQNLIFGEYRMPARRNSPEFYDAKDKKPGGKREGMLKLGAIEPLPAGRAVRMAFVTLGAIGLSLTALGIVFFRRRPN